jgi:hypothetical protein
LAGWTSNTSQKNTKCTNIWNVLTRFDSMRLAIFLENFLLFLKFFIQIWKHVKFSTNSGFFWLNDREPVGPDRYTGRAGRYTGGSRLNHVFRFEIRIYPVSTGFRPNRTGKPVPNHAGSVRPVGIKKPWFEHYLYSESIFTLFLINIYIYRVLYIYIENQNDQYFKMVGMCFQFTTPSVFKLQVALDFSSLIKKLHVYRHKNVKTGCSSICLTTILLAGVKILRILLWHSTPSSLPDQLQPTCNLPC